MTLMSLVAITMIANAAPTPFVRPVPPKDPIRVRLAHASTHALTFSLTGVNVVLNDRAYTGLHSFIVREGRVDGITLQTIAGDSLRVNLKPAPSSLRVSGRNLIAILDLEDYLRGVLPAEMPASWPLEALKAQAVAARTFAMNRREHAGTREFDVDTDVRDQMFASGTSRATDRALEETRGEVLRDSRGRLIAAYFHSDCGGHTELADNVWGTHESIGSVGCPYQSGARWSLRLSALELGTKLRQKISSLALGPLNESGRVAFVSVNGLKMDAAEFRQALGFTALKSTAFSLKRAGDAYVFEGHGNGHGVGLCQYGARKMAQDGRGYREILAHFYPKARLDLDAHPDLNDEERNGADNKQAAQFHKNPFPRL